MLTHRVPDAAGDRHPMITGAITETIRQPAVSELVLSDRLIKLAEDADRAGYTRMAAHLLSLACSVFDEAAKRPQ